MSRSPTGTLERSSKGTKAAATEANIPNKPSFPRDWAAFKQWLAQPVNGASLALFRIALGIVMSLEAWSLCRSNPAAISSGLSPMATYYTGPNIKFNFPYAAFEWLPVLPGPWMYALVGILAVAGITMALGLCYRLSAAMVFLAWGYFFAIESTRTYWQSHFYLELLLCFLMIWMPAARRYSLDAWLARAKTPPKTVPYWTLVLLRGQLVIAYFYAGVAKINLDWILDAVPIRWYLARQSVTGPYEHLMTPAHYQTFQNFVHSAGFAYFISYTGLLFDCAVGFLLLARRTRIFALILMVLFHTTNHFLIFRDIGWFPLVGIATALIFLDPDWPERFSKWIRKPHLAKPDRKWFRMGVVLFPVVGASLGWKLKPSRAVPAPNELSRFGPLVAPLVLTWLISQSLLPLRHYAIPGDGRFTYEGLSFSWRLKADAHHARFAEIFVRDNAIISAGDNNVSRINWNNWHGEKVLYRRITPGRMNWPQLPEIFVALDPLMGERILYNPFAASVPIRSEAEARDRVNRIWLENYGRPAQSVFPTAPLPEVLERIADGLRRGGAIREAGDIAALMPGARQLLQPQIPADSAARIRNAILARLTALRARDPGGAMLPFLRRIDPFVLQGEHSVSVLLIEDSQLLDSTPAQSPRVKRSLWKNGPSTQSTRDASGLHDGGPPLVVYTDEIGPEALDLFPSSYLLDSQDNPEPPPHICWNTPKDCASSKFTHISNQAFYLRRYARRVAGLWEKDYGRRPIVTAKTAVSLNGRPHQPLVDPEVDLASVPVKWFGHNAWVMDLQTPRVPREVLSNGGQFVGD